MATSQRAAQGVRELAKRGPMSAGWQALFLIACISEFSHRAPSENDKLFLGRTFWVNQKATPQEFHQPSTKLRKQLARSRRVGDYCRLHYSWLISFYTWMCLEWKYKILNRFSWDLLWLWLTALLSCHTPCPCTLTATLSAHSATLQLPNLCACVSHLEGIWAI